MKETFVIGDVHGCFHTLVALLERLPAHAEIIMVGDLCDRGLYSCEVIDLVIERGFRVVLGNHDVYMIEELEKCLSDNSYCPKWIRDPSFLGGPTVASYRDRNEKAAEHVTWLKTLPTYIEHDTFFITHGFGLPYYQNRSLSSAQFAMIRNRLHSPYRDTWEKGWEEYPVINIFGHESDETIRRGSNWICIDTGCGFENKLTALSLTTLNTISILVDPQDFSTEVSM